MRNAYVMFLIVFALSCDHLPMAWAGNRLDRGLDADQLEMLERRNDERRAEKNTSMVFYGEVVDLDGNPVSAALVRMHKTYVPYSVTMSDHKFIEALTDSSGRFMVEENGFSLYLDEIIGAGYQYDFRYNKRRGFDYVKGRQHSGPGFEPDKPFTFRIRKLAPASFVVLHNMTFGLKTGSLSELDLIRREWVEPSRVFTQKMMFPDWHPDLRLSVEGEPGSLRLVLEAPDPDSGFVVEKHEFFEVMTDAPEHGYRQRVEFPVRPGESPVMVYVKCQGGLFYGKIHIGFSEDRPGTVAVNATSFTNLAKGRGLEYIPAVESRYDEEVYGKHSRQSVRRADLLSGRPIEMPRPRESEVAR